jgi:hypothetical protein
VLGPAARHHRVDGQLLDGGDAEAGLEGGDDLAGIATRPRKHGVHRAPGGGHQREAVAPAALEELAVEPLPGLENVRPVEAQALLGRGRLPLGERLDGLGQARQDLLEGPVHHSVDGLGVLVREGQRDHGQREPRQAEGGGAPARILDEGLGREDDGGDPSPLQLHHVVDTPRRA